MKDIKTLKLPLLAVVVVVVVVTVGAPLSAVMAAVPRPLSSWTTVMPHGHRSIAATSGATATSMANVPQSSRLAFVGTTTTTTVRGGSSPVYDEDEEADDEEEEAELIMDVDGDDDVEEELEGDEFDEEDEEEWETLEELEEDILAVEVEALDEEEDLLSALEDEVGDEIVDEILDEVDDIDMDEEQDCSPVFFGASTTDGELADDEGEGTDSITTPEDLVAVTAGGASLVMEEEEEEEDNEGNEGAEGEAAVATADVEEITEISDEMKQVLCNELEYTKREIKLMRPDVAAMVVYNRLIRPGEGMPPNFYVEGAGPPSFLQENLPKICLGIALATATGFAYGRIKEGDVDLSEVTDALKTIPKAFVAATAAIKGKVVGVLPSKKKPVSMHGAIMAMPGEVMDVEVVEETIGGSKTYEEKDDTVHSLKPGTKEGPKLDEDKSALDKVLTKIEEAIKAFFRITI